MERFDPLHPIARQTLLLEASAGTGKTYSISGKIVRLIAEEGIDIDRILIVTFTRAATAELVDRIRSILIEARDALEAKASSDHVVIAGLKKRADEEGPASPLRERYLTRLKRAIARFDLASIFTIHSFSERALSLAAFEIGFDPSHELVADIRNAIHRASDDLFLEALQIDRGERGGSASIEEAENGDRGFRLSDEHEFRPETFRKLAEARWSLRDAAIARLVGVDESDSGSSRDAVWMRTISHFCERIVDRIERELEKRRAIGFDQLIHHLKRALEDETMREALIGALRSRYDAALIDEFQDTDEAQWAIFRTIFGDGKIFELVGDPKQAIYSFRGADIEVYKRARREASKRYTLDINYRSSPDYIQAMNLFFGTTAGLSSDGVGHEASTPFASEDIPYLKIGAPPSKSSVRIVTRSGKPMAPLRLLRAAIGQDEPGKLGFARETADHILTEEILDLLAHGEFVEGTTRRPIRPSDIAVLTRRRSRGADIAERLRSQGVRCVSPKENPLFLSEAAAIVENLLQLSLEPTNRAFLRSLAFGPLFRLGRSELDDDEDNQLEHQIAALIDEFRQGLDELGVGASLLRLLSRPFERQRGERELILARLLRRQGGERLVTDLRHLSEVLHLAAVEEHLSKSAILKFLQEERARAKDAEEAEEYAVRLESDADALTITTMHASKGLEYPIVFIAELDEFRKLRSNEIFVFHDGKQRVIDPFTPIKGKPRTANMVQANKLNFEESLRLLYVAFTRAKYHCVAVIHPPYRRSPSKANPRGSLQWGSFADSPLAHVLFRSDDADGKTRVARAIKEDDIASLDAVGDALAKRSVVDDQALIEYRVVRELAELTPYQGEAESTELIPPAKYAGPTRFHSYFGRHSYTQVVRHGRYERALGLIGGMEEHGELGEDVIGPSLSFTTSPNDGLVLADFPKGARAGSFIHFVLEELDFQTGQPKEKERSLRVLMRRTAAKAGFFGRREEAFVSLEEALPAILATPLGGNLGELSLSDLSVEDRLDELDFVMPIAASTAPDRPRVEVGELPDIFGRGREVPLQYELEGFMNGSMDLVFRARGADGIPRYYLADYKSNALGGAEAYHPERLREAMDAHEYWIQAAFYLLALDAFLAHRLGEAYEYERDFGGVYYLFLRGMIGKDAVMPDGSGVRGVLALRPNEAEMDALRRWLREGFKKEARDRSRRDIPARSSGGTR